MFDLDGRRAFATEPDVKPLDQPQADRDSRVALAEAERDAGAWVKDSRAASREVVTGNRLLPVVRPTSVVAAARRMRRSGIISIAVHGALLALMLLWFRHGGQLVVETPDTLPAVELVMVEQQGTGQTGAPPVPAPEVDNRAAAEAPAAPPAPEAPPAAPAPPAPPPPVAAAEPTEALPVPPPPAAPAATASRPRRAAPPAPPVAAAPEINLGGTNSETNAIASGPNIIPASLDTKFHNKEPLYPPEAVRRAQQGSVLLVAHVSPEGLANDVDVLSSSGYVSLDRAARDAVASWHFLPAVKDGQAIPFDMTLRVVFRLD